MVENGSRSQEVKVKKQWLKRSKFWNVSKLAIFYSVILALLFLHYLIYRTTFCADFRSNGLIHFILFFLYKDKVETFCVMLCLHYAWVFFSLVIINDPQVNVKFW